MSKRYEKVSQSEGKPRLPKVQTFYPHLSHYSQSLNSSVDVEDGIGQNHKIEKSNSTQFLSDAQNFSSIINQKSSDSLWRKLIQNSKLAKRNLANSKANKIDQSNLNKAEEYISDAQESSKELEELSLSKELKFVKMDTHLLDILKTAPGYIFDENFKLNKCNDVVEILNTPGLTTEVEKYKNLLNSVEMCLSDQIKEKSDSLYDILSTIKDLNSETEKTQKKIEEAKSDLESASTHFSDTHLAIVNAKNRLESVDQVHLVLTRIDELNRSYSTSQNLNDNGRYLEAYNLVNRSLTNVKKNNLEKFKIVEITISELKSLSVIVRKRLFNEFCEILFDQDLKSDEFALNNITEAFIIHKDLGFVFSNIEARLKDSVRNIFATKDELALNASRDFSVVSADIGNYQFKIQDFFNKMCRVKTCLENVDCKELKLQSRDKEEKYYKNFLVQLNSSISKVSLHVGKFFVKLIKKHKDILVSLDLFELIFWMRDFLRFVEDIQKQTNTKQKKLLDYLKVVVKKTVLRDENLKSDQLSQSLHTETWLYTSFSKNLQKQIDTRFIEKEEVFEHTILGRDKLEKLTLSMSQLQIDNSVAENHKKQYSLTNSLLSLLYFVIDYLKIVKLQNNFTFEVSQSLVSLIQLYSDETKKIFLNGEIVKNKNIANLTLKHLTQSSEALELLAILLPDMKAFCAQYCSDLNHFDRLLRKLITHKSEIFQKIREAVRNIVVGSCDSFCERFVNQTKTTKSPEKPENVVSHFFEKLVKNLRLTKRLTSQHLNKAENENLIEFVNKVLEESFLPVLVKLEQSSVSQDKVNATETIFENVGFVYENVKLIWPINPSLQEKFLVFLKKSEEKK